MQVSDGADVIKHRPVGTHPLSKVFNVRREGGNRRGDEVDIVETAEIDESFYL